MTRKHIIGADDKKRKLKPLTTHTHTHSHTQVVAVTSVKFSDHPVQLRCNHCQKDVVTHLDYTPGALTWIVVAVLFILGFWL